MVAPPELVAPLKIPERSKRYLLTVGLPTHDVDPGLVFNTVARLPTLRELYPDPRYQLHESWGNARFLGYRDDVGVYFNEQDGGTVWQIGLPDGSAAFLNSSVEQLGYFAAAVNEPVPELDRTSPDQCRQALSELREVLRQADPDAFAEDDNFWPLVLEDAYFYL